EDGIRDRNVTGVQTCALPIYHLGMIEEHLGHEGARLEIPAPLELEDVPFGADDRTGGEAREKIPRLAVALGRSGAVGPAARPGADRLAPRPGFGSGLGFGFCSGFRLGCHKVSPWV